MTDKPAGFLHGCTTDGSTPDETPLVRTTDAETILAEVIEYLDGQKKLPDELLAKAAKLRKHGKK